MQAFEIYHTYSLILITVVVSILAFNLRPVMDRLILWPPAMQRGQYDRFITHGFVHADAMHLLFNMITLFFFGQVIESFYRQYLNGMGFAVFYLGALVVAVFPSYWQNRRNSRWATLGASGAVSAVLFAYILFDPWNLIFVFFIPVPAIVFALLYVAYSIWADRQRRDNVNHSAHLFGAAYGVLVTLAIEPRMLPYFLNKLINIPYF